MKIAVFSECSSEYGRRLVDGVASFARKAHNWRLSWFNPSVLPSRDTLAEFDGIIARVANDSMARCLRKTGLPVVDVFCQREYSDFLSVNSNHDEIGELAATHLLAKRHTAFAFVGFQGVSFSDKRKQAFANALAKRGCSAQCCLIPLLRDQRTFFNTEAYPVVAESALRKWLEKLPHPVALFAANDLLAVNAARIARDIGIDIPGDMAVLGVDDDRLLCAFADTPISSIDPNAFGIGFAAAKRLDCALNALHSPTQHSVLRIPPNGIIERTSTERHAISPQWLARILGYIDAELDKPLSTADLVALTGLSHVTISRTFAEKLGMSPLQYITSVKMHAARKLLERGDLLVKEVAARVGYRSIVRFSVVYKSFFGTPPSQMKDLSERRKTLK